VAEDDQVVRFPLGAALKVGFGRLALTLLVGVANSAVAYVFMVFTLSYGTQNLHYDRQFLILSVTGSAALWFATIPVWTRIADRHGRRAMFVAGSAALLLWCLAFFPLLNTGGTGFAMLALAGMGLIIPITHCVQGAIIADTFPANVRFSGMSLLLQGGAILGGGLAPMIATAVLNATGSTTGITWYLVGICGVSMISATVLFRLTSAHDPAPAIAA
jgi:MFS family permease